MVCLFHQEIEIFRIFLKFYSNLTNCRGEVRRLFLPKHVIRSDLRTCTMHECYRLILIRKSCSIAALLDYNGWYFLTKIYTYVNTGGNREMSVITQVSGRDWT